MKIIKTYIRIYLGPSELEPAVIFYERVLGEPARLRFQYLEVGLEVAEIGHVLLIAGTDEALKPFRSTQATFLVSSIEEARKELLSLGARILAEPKKVPPGMNMRVRHPDGTTVEYVEHRQ